MAPPVAAAPPGRPGSSRWVNINERCRYPGTKPRETGRVTQEAQTQNSVLCRRSFVFNPRDNVCIKCIKATGATDTWTRQAQPDIAEHDMRLRRLTLCKAASYCLHSRNNTGSGTETLEESTKQLKYLVCHSSGRH